MDKGTINLLAYYCIAEINIIPRLSYVEKTTLAFLRKGYTKEYIADKLKLDMSKAIADLIDKNILREDRIFKYRYLEDFMSFVKKEYVHGVIFFHLDEGMFFNTFLYHHELKIKDNVLSNSLGNSFINKDILDSIVVLDKQSLYYNMTNIKARRRLTQSAFQYLDYIYEG